MVDVIRHQIFPFARSNARCSSRVGGRTVRPDVSLYCGLPWAWAPSALSSALCRAMLPDPILGSDDCAKAGEAMRAASAATAKILFITHSFAIDIPSICRIADAHSLVSRRKGV